MIQWSIFDIVLVSLGIAAVISYLVAKIILFKKGKLKPKKNRKDDEDEDIIDVE